MEQEKLIIKEITFPNGKKFKLSKEVEIEKEEIDKMDVTDATYYMYVLCKSLLEEVKDETI